MDDEQIRRFWRGENGPRDNWMQFLLSFLIMLSGFTDETTAFLMLEPSTQESFRDLTAFIRIIAYLGMTEMFGAARCMNRDPTELLRLLRFGSRGTPAERPEEDANRRLAGNERVSKARRQEREGNDGTQRCHGGSVWRSEVETEAWRQRVGGPAPWGPGIRGKTGWRFEGWNGNLCNNCGSYLHRTEACPLSLGKACTHAKRRLWNRTHKGQCARINNPYPFERELRCSFCNVFGHCINTCDLFEQRNQIWCHRCGRYGSHLSYNCPGNAK